MNGVNGPVGPDAIPGKNRLGIKRGYEPSQSDIGFIHYYMIKVGLLMIILGYLLSIFKLINSEIIPLLSFNMGILVVIYALFSEAIENKDLQPIVRAGMMISGAVIVLGWMLFMGYALRFY